MSPRLRIGLLSASPLIAMLFNVIRLSVTVSLYAVASENVAGHFHDASGWLIPLVMMAAILLMFHPGKEAETS